MNITITSHGTRGDVQPYLALAVGLQKAGHRVTLVTSWNYTDWIQSYGIHTHPTQFSIQEFMKKPEVQAILKGRNFIKQLQVFREMMGEGPKAMDDVWAAIQNADFVIQSPTSSGALETSMKRSIPVAMAYPVPFAPTRAYPSIFLGRVRASLGEGYNRLTHSFMHRMLWGSMSGPMATALRKKLNLPSIKSFAEKAAFMRQKGIPTLYGFSEHVLPRPADWNETQHITGYWFLESLPEWQPDPALLKFLDSGPPPVYLGFGSINLGDSENKTRLILDALEKTGQRGVVLTGWGGLTRLTAPSHIFFVDDVPHHWLFPRMAAVMHHGGAGTTGAGLRAGVPNILTPIGADQYFWAERVVKLGVGPKAPEIKKLTSESLANAIHTTLNDQGIRARAAALGEKIRAEDGIARAVEIIEQYASKQP